MALALPCSHVTRSHVEHSCPSSQRGHLQSCTGAAPLFRPYNTACLPWNTPIGSLSAFSRQEASLKCRAAPNFNPQNVPDPQASYMACAQSTGRCTSGRPNTALLVVLAASFILALFWFDCTGHAPARTICRGGCTSPNGRTERQRFSLVVQANVLHSQAVLVGYSDLSVAAVLL